MAADASTHPDQTGQRPAGDGGRVSSLDPGWRCPSAGERAPINVNGVGVARRASADEIRSRMAIVDVDTNAAQTSDSHS